MECCNVRWKLRVSVVYVFARLVFRSEEGLTPEGGFTPSGGTYQRSNGQCRDERAQGLAMVRARWDGCGLGLAVGFARARGLCGVRALPREPWARL